MTFLYRPGKAGPRAFPGDSFHVDASTQELARLRPDIDQRRLARLHHGDRFLDRGAELRRILDRTLGPPAHRFRELVILDIRVLDAGADRTHVVAQARHAVAEVG